MHLVVRAVVWCLILMRPPRLPISCPPQVDVLVGSCVDMLILFWGSRDTSSGYVSCRELCRHIFRVWGLRDGVKMLTPADNFFCAGDMLSLMESEREARRLR